MKLNSIVTIGLLLASVFLLQSCGNKYLGKTLSPGDYADVSESGHHHVVLKHLNMNYACVVSENEESITFDGNIQFRKKGLSDGWNVSEMVFTVYFLDITRKVIGIGYITLWPNQSAGNEIPFRKKFKYNKEYKYVTYSYEASAWF